MSTDGRRTTECEDRARILKQNSQKLKPKPYLRWPRGPEVDPSIETPTEELGLGQVISEFSALLTILCCLGWVINRLHIVKTADDQIMGLLKANRRVTIDHANSVTLQRHADQPPCFFLNPLDARL